MNKQRYLFNAVGILMLLTSQLFAQGTVKTIRATKLTPQIWTQLNKGEIKELVIEFRKGDELPVTLQFEGDLLETSESNESYVTVKTSFWIRMEQNDLKISLDGATFKPFRDLLLNTLTAGASSDDPAQQKQSEVANAISLGLKSVLK